MYSFIFYFIDSIISWDNLILPLHIGIEPDFEKVVLGDYYWAHLS